MRKLPITPLALGLFLAVFSPVFAQTYTSNPSNPAADLSSAGITMPGAGARATNRSSNDDSTPDTDEDLDPTLTRRKTSDSVGSGLMSRDDGELTAKARRREKVTVVDSKKLQSSGVDPKFQGSLLHSSVTSIDDISAKANNPIEAGHTAHADHAPADHADHAVPRFSDKATLFSEPTREEASKKESHSAKADSSPAPSAAPSAKPSSR